MTLVKMPGEKMRVTSIGRMWNATVRSLDSEGDVRTAVRRGDADDSGLEIVAAELTADNGWAAAAAGCEEVHHVASPTIQTDDPNDVIVPAREGTIHVLRAARDAGVRRVVLTSSFVAVGYTSKPGFEYTEADWTDPDTPGLPAYPLSKVIAEHTAWDFIKREGGETELVTFNPTFILGPTLTTQARSSLALIKAMLDGHMPVVRRQRFGVADVRDVADVHIRAGPKALLTLFGAEHGLGGISGYDVAETTDENPERVAAVAALTWAYLRSQLDPEDPAWPEAREALAVGPDPFGRIESK